MQATLPPLASALRVRLPVKEGEDEIGISLSQAAARAAAAISRATSRAVHPPALANAEVRFILTAFPAGCSLTPCRHEQCWGHAKGSCCCVSTLHHCLLDAALLCRSQGRDSLHVQPWTWVAETMALEMATSQWLRIQMAETGVLCLWVVSSVLCELLTARPMASGLPPAGHLPLRSAVLQPEASHQCAIKSHV